jgi:hypothetical protein
MWHLVRHIYKLTKNLLSQPFTFLSIFPMYSCCPYCDGQWPPAPSATLSELLEKAKMKSYGDPRPENPMGLMAPLTVFVDVCQRHRLETTQLPLAIQCGWPTKLNFSQIPKHLRAFRESLSHLVENPSSSQFWCDAKDVMKQLGKTKFSSVTGQFATFEKVLPG